MAALTRFRKHWLVELAVTLAVAAGIAYAVQLWVVKPYQIPSASMLGTFQIGDRIMAARFVYRFSDPHRGDVIVFHPNGYGGTAEDVAHVASVVFVKRLIGLPGEWIDARDGHVEICRQAGHVGCQRLREPYVSSPQESFPPIHVAPGHYFLMGDNRSDSDDSRIWGTIRRSQIIGRAFMIYWPLDRVRFF